MLDFSKLHHQGWTYLEKFDCGISAKDLLQEFPLNLPKAKEVYGNVKQDFYYKYYAIDQLSEFPVTTSLVRTYLNEYEKQQGFETALTPVIAFNSYSSGGIIDPHRDESRYRNVISIFTLSGEAPFAIYASDRKTKTAEFILRANSLLLLAAPRNDLEKDIRPIHSVGPTTSERKAIVIRHDKLKK